MDHTPLMRSEYQNTQGVKLHRRNQRHDDRHPSERGSPLVNLISFFLFGTVLLDFTH